MSRSPAHENRAYLDSHPGNAAAFAGRPPWLSSFPLLVENPGMITTKSWQQQSSSNITCGRVEEQVAAMGVELFEVGLFNPDVRVGKPAMLLRVWNTATILKSVPWLRRQNSEGRNIYIRPNGEHDLSMIDDLTKDSVSAMKGEGFAPAVVVETSPGNYQAWLKHRERLTKEVSTAAARVLAEKFGGDRSAADWRHFGRLAGFTNRKSKYVDASTGLYPFVRLIEAAGGIYPEAKRFLIGLKNDLTRRHAELERLKSWQLARSGAIRSQIRKSIDVFRAEGRYGADGTRVDLAYAVYALTRGASVGEVEAAIRSRDLSHKGNERRQDDYVERTIRKAQATVQRGR